MIIYDYLFTANWLGAIDYIGSQSIQRIGQAYHFFNAQLCLPLLSIFLLKYGNAAIIIGRAD